MYDRNEYPKPQLSRDEWLALNGEWEFEFDDAGDGDARGLCDGKAPLGGRILVPYCYQCEASGIGDKTYHKTVWYRKTVSLPAAQRSKRALLNFNGCDYETDVWVNGRHAAKHFGAYGAFSADITPYLTEGENAIVVRCIDPLDPTIPRGKQSWTGEPFTCWYTPSTGIWQSVWMDFCGADNIEAITLTPDIDTLSFCGEIVTGMGEADSAEITVSFGGKQVKREAISLCGRHTRYSVALGESDFVDENTYWTPETPNLYYVDITLKKGSEVADKIHTRFGMRSISVDGSGNITLNHRKLYQRLILDQGYWDKSGITPPSKDALRADIAVAKAMGFNGARKHQKWEDPYFYYYADEMGFLCWCEMPSAYNFCAEEIGHITAEWQEIISSARLFSSIVCYVPLNESWGVRKILTDGEQQNFARSLYYLTKSLDGSRLVSTNDGWENLDSADIVAIHDYAFDSSEFADKYRPENYDSIYPQGRKLMAHGNTAAGLPALLTEFGGIAMKNSAVDGNWGYNKSAVGAEELYARLSDLLNGIRACPFQGYCYTQLTDVQQEVNGLLTADRKPKADFMRLKKIFEG